MGAKFQEILHPEQRKAMRDLGEALHLQTTETAPLFVVSAVLSPGQRETLEIIREDPDSKPKLEGPSLRVAFQKKASYKP